MRRDRWFRWGDLVPAVVCVAAAAIGFWLPLTAATGDVARVHTPTEELLLPLDEDALMTVTGHDGLTVTIAVGNGTVCVSAADCPDQVCVHTGALSKNGQTAACLPSGVAVTVESDDGPDAVVR